MIFDYENFWDLICWLWRIINGLWQSAFESIMGKEENECNQHFLHFPWCFLPLLTQIELYTQLIVCNLDKSLKLSPCKGLNGKSSYRIGWNILSLLVTWLILKLVYECKIFRIDCNDNSICNILELFFVNLISYIQKYLFSLRELCPWYDCTHV